VRADGCQEAFVPTGSASHPIIRAGDIDEAPPLFNEYCPCAHSCAAVRDRMRIALLAE